MILFNINSSSPLPQIPGLDKAIDFLKNCPADQPNGTVEIDGEDVFAIVQSYETKQQKEAPRFESHRKYIDVQYLLSGRELMGWAPLESVTVTEPYDDDKDILFGTAPANQSAFISFTAGQAIILLPTDAHAPGLTKGAPRPVKKIVVKVRSSS
jgi:biofilm protein TabA